MSMAELVAAIYRKFLWPKPQNMELGPSVVWADVGSRRYLFFQNLQVRELVSEKIADTPHSQRMQDILNS